MMTYDRVLPELIRICSGDATSHDSLARYCVVRDVRGRVRLVVEPSQGANPDLRSLESKLADALGSYFVPPILSNARGGDRQRLATNLFNVTRGRWPTGWPRSYRNVLGGAETPIQVDGRWVGIERTIGKEAWLSADPPKPPWPLLKGKVPPIITFHSFKGGVGRTTLVASHAIALANQTNDTRVAIVDLDLEAPGVGALLGVDTEHGVLDVLIDHIATGELNIDGVAAHAQLGHPSDSRITIYPAGKVNDSYVQKLARLDFSSMEPGSQNPVGAAMNALLKRMRPNFDVILLDSRAGLHDLAGMSLHGLAHLDVLVFRGTQQHLTGLEQTLRMLGARDSARLVLAETLLPATDDELSERRRKQNSEKVYRMLLEHVYPEVDPPQPEDDGEPHDVIAIRRKEWLEALDSFEGRVGDILRDPELNRLTSRINEECALSAADADSSDENEV